jgi:hypothetical protein
MHVPISLKSPNNISEWQMGFNSAFKGLIENKIKYKLITNRLMCQKFRPQNLITYQFTKISRGFLRYYMPIQALVQLRKNSSMYFSFHNHYIVLPVDSILLLLFKRTRVQSSMVSVEFFIYVVLPAALWPSDRLNF